MFKAGEKQKRNYDLKQFKYNYKVGDLVWLFTPAVKKGRTKKLSSQWTGPFKIIEILSDVVIRIRQKPNSQDKVVHHNRLKPYYK